MKRYLPIVFLSIMLTAIAWPAGLVLAGVAIAVWLLRLAGRLAKRFIIWLL